MLANEKALKMAMVAALKVVPDVALIVALAIALTACGAKKTEAPEVVTVQKINGYTASQAMIVVATERNRYSRPYTNAIWDVALEGKGQTVETYLLSQVREFLKNVKLMNALAKTEGLEVAETVEGQLEELAQRYYSGLSEDDLAFIGCTQADVLTLYREYYIANKIVEEKTAGIDLEMSDSEVKVIQLYQIKTSDEETAREAYEKCQAEGADFKAIAGVYSRDPDIEVTVGKGEESPEYEAVAFALGTGEMSGIMHLGDTYYILYCASDYDLQATRSRKEEIYIAKRRQLFADLCYRFTAEYPIEYEDGVWDGISLKTQWDTTTGNFFTLYHDVFGG
ncbi:MAG: peptidylprolyl isomerase [Lachnospiraceae bacterium]|nr:peptidylprolyl isomerase [Lachnospiraceae bacterium]